MPCKPTIVLQMQERSNAKSVKVQSKINYVQRNIGEMSRLLVYICASRKIVFILLFSVGWCFRQIDYVLVFSHAPIDTKLYCHLIAAFNVGNMVKIMRSHFKNEIVCEIRGMKT